RRDSAPFPPATAVVEADELDRALTKGARLESKLGGLGTLVGCLGPIVRRPLVELVGDLEDARAVRHIHKLRLVPQNPDTTHQGVGLWVEGTSRLFVGDSGRFEPARTLHHLTCLKGNVLDGTGSRTHGLTPHRARRSRRADG